VIATYNRPEHVRTCLEHIEQQTRRPDDVVVVDSSPDRRTAEVTRDFPGARYLRNEAGPGTLPTSRAIGVASTTAEVIAFIDDDAYAEPAWLGELVSRYADPAVGAVGGRARNGQPGEESEGIGEIGRLLPNGHLTGFFAADPGRDLDVDHFIGANFSVRREALERIGGIHEWYPGTCLREEADMALRLGRAGYRIVFTPAAAVDHVAGPYAKGRRFDLRYQYYSQRNHMVLLGTALGLGDPHLRSYVVTAGREMAQHLRAGIRALKDPTRHSTNDRARGFAGGAAKAATVGIGLASGTVAALRHDIVSRRSQGSPQA
jgi:GT2 family glycosyltransferase